MIPPHAQDDAAGSVEPAPAKVNLFLHVTGRRADGYHLLDSLVVFAGAGDALRAAPAGDLTLVVEGAEAAALSGEGDNLVLRAARALAAATGRAPAAALRLEKCLPVASGIGGGSADAAAALRLLSRFWGVAPGAAAMDDLALALGADVPSCLRSAPLRMGGVGERIAPVPALPPMGIVLANPRLALSTPAVFRARGGGFSAPAALPGRGWATAEDLARALRTTANDLESPAIALCPPVADVLAALRAAPGCLLARMSGSGATCFAIHSDPSRARTAAAALPAAWWRWGGGLHAPAG